MSFSKILRDWYSKNKRILPWRKTKNPYFVWLSEIILQQTQVKQGLPYYEKFVEEYPTVFDLANASEEEVLKSWQGLGYYSRARNLHATAKIVAEKHRGIFPNNYRELIKLKGIGDYTASAIASICFEENQAVVDGNVYRVLSRYYGIDLPINSTQGVKYFKNLAQELLDHSFPGEHNQAVMEFGARHCTPNNPNCETCPLNESCFALANNKVKDLPVKIKKTKVKDRYFNYLVIINESRIALEQRKNKGIWENLYQFPLIETKKAITDKELIDMEELHGIISEPSEIYLYNEKDIVHKLSHQNLHTKFWIVSTSEILTEKVDLEELNRYPVPVLISKFLEEYELDY